MLLVLSPAKTLDYQTPAPTDEATRPEFMPQAAELINVLQTFSPAQIGEMMSLSDQLASLNAVRYAAWSPEYRGNDAKQAIFAFNGDVYQGLDAATLDEPSITYVQSRVRVLSGLYGLLRPLDLIQPHRLEMGTRLVTERGRNLYDFWGGTITSTLNKLLKQQRASVLINLASEEYFKAVKTRELKASIVTPVFEDWKSGCYKVISFHAKRARGLMARYAAQRQLDDPAKLVQFDLDGYAFVPSASTDTRIVFRRRVAA